jgi:dihydrofolate synthase/folylpolyglutamate synthase
MHSHSALSTQHSALSFSTQHPSLSYQEALDFWFGRINYEQRSAKPSDLKLDRMRTLLGLLGNPQQKLRVVHVAGSKGKGSTSAMLESVLRHAGYRTGLFTSPHLNQVEERIQVDRVPIQPVELASLMADIAQVVGWGGEVVKLRGCNVLPAADRNGLPPPRHLTTSPPHDLASLTFFEVATALGFLHFARRRVDVAVVEVGLGGRFDSTNVCQPLVSVITSISYDHTQQLGNRLASIAMEKAGIIKPGRQTVSGVRVPEARAVIEETCRQRRSPLRQLGIDFRYQYEPGVVRNQESGVRSQEPGVRGQGSGISSQESGISTHHSSLITHHWLRPSRVRVITPRRAWPSIQLGLLGEHQAANAAVVIACVEHLKEKGFHIDDRAVWAGLAEVRWPARMEVVGRQPLVVLDCAHNVASAQALVDTLLTSFPPLHPGPSTQHSALTAQRSPLTNDMLKKRFLLFAGSSDKDLAGMLRVLAPHFAQAFLTRFSHSPRAVPPEQLADILRQASVLPFSLHSSPAEAWQSARAAAGPDDLICITGSVFLAGELRPMLVDRGSGFQSGRLLVS